MSLLVFRIIMKIPACSLNRACLFLKMFWKFLPAHLIGPARLIGTQEYLLIKELKNSTPNVYYFWLHGDHMLIRATRVSSWENFLILLSVVSLYIYIIIVNPWKKLMGFILLVRLQLSFNRIKSSAKLRVLFKYRPDGGRGTFGKYP